MLNRLYSWYGKNVVRAILLVIVALAVTAVIVTRRDNGNTETAEPLRIVNVATVSSLSDHSSIELIGEVEAVDQASIQAEVSGRVTSVSAVLGGQVTQGQVIGQMENASERAQVLQAEGAYEAALAAAAQSDSSVLSAETAYNAALSSGINTYRNAFTATDDVIRNTIDIFFSDPTGSIPGFRLNSLGRANELNETRKRIKTTLSSWSKIVLSSPERGNALTYLTQIEPDVAMIADFVETVSLIAADKKNDGKSVGGTFIGALRSELTIARTTMNTARQNVGNAIRDIEDTEDARERARIGGTNTDISAANAHVKQALGSLRAAEANLEKTIFRSSINGTLNLLNIKVGDFVNSNMLVASVANNDALLITTYVGESDKTRLQTGDSVRIEGTYTGVITNIAPAVDPVTKKVEVQIQVETNELSNGDTVGIAISSEDTKLDTDSRIFVPLTAVKFSSVDGSILRVEGGVITARPVVLGDVQGSNVEVLEGVSLSDEIITDARGLNPGQEVEVNRGS